jgi:ring-1,2-phenylacetyl-CoA epoxidase subunit PaaD
VVTSDAPAARRDATEAAAIWRALSTVVDPEIPSVSIVELGIVRGVDPEGDDWVVSITPTYSGCPATRVIESDIRGALAKSAPTSVRVRTLLAPAWTTDWIAPEARRKLREAGIAPPRHGAPDAAVPLRILRGERKASGSTEPAGPASQAAGDIACPRCGSLRTSLVARFGSTACKAQYRCLDCLEPFDYFKPY